MTTDQEMRKSTVRIIAHRHLPEWNTVSVVKCGAVEKATVRCQCGCSGIFVLDIAWNSPDVVGEAKIAKPL